MEQVLQRMDGWILTVNSLPVRGPDPRRDGDKCRIFRISDFL